MNHFIMTQWRIQGWWRGPPPPPWGKKRVKKRKFYFFGDGAHLPPPPPPPTERKIDRYHLQILPSPPKKSWIRACHDIWCCMCMNVYWISFMSPFFCFSLFFVSACPGRYYRCADHRCLSLDMLCDGTPNCANNEDEENCGEWFYFAATEDCSYEIYLIGRAD